MTVDLEPGFLQQTGPHVDSFDWLREQRDLTDTQNIVVNVDELLFAADVHPDDRNPVRVALCDDQVGYQLRVLSQEAKKSTEGLHHLVCIAEWSTSNDYLGRTAISRLNDLVHTGFSS